MKQLKIAYLMTQSMESPNGLGRIGPLARALGNRNHDIHVIALHPDFYALEETSFIADGIRVTYVAPMHVKKSGNRKSYYSSAGLARVALQATWQFSRAALTTPADILHICKPHPMNGIAGLISGLVGNKLLFVDCDDYETAANKVNSKWQKDVLSFFETKIPKRAAAVTANTQFIIQKLVDWGVAQADIYYLPNGVETARFKPPSKEQVTSLKAALGLEDKKVIAYIGSLSLATHGVDLLLEAFVLIRQALPDSRLLIAGGGEDYDVLVRMTQDLGIQDDVHFCGRVDPAEIPRYYHLAAVSVDPVYDNDAARGRMPLKLFESWACDVPFVTADVGDRRGILGDPPAGALARPGDAKSLADAIIHLLISPEAGAACRERGRDRLAEYTWDRLAGKLEEFYLARLSEYKE